MHSQTSSTEEHIGKNYTIKVESWRDQKKYGFSIVAVHRKSKRQSCINTLNTILSWFGIEEDSELVSESDWYLTRKKWSEYRKSAREIFGNKKSLTYLERQLDEDRSCGEWANLSNAAKQNA